MPKLECICKNDKKASKQCGAEKELKEACTLQLLTTLCVCVRAVGGERIPFATLVSLCSVQGVQKGVGHLDEPKSGHLP